MSTITKRVWKVGGIERSAWIVRYTDQSGKRHIKTFETKGAAQAWAVTALHEIKIGVHSPESTSLTVTAAWELWLRHCEANLERGTVKQREEHLRLHVAPFVGGEKLARLTTPRIYSLDDQLREAGRSLSMRRKVLTNVGVMLAFAQGRGLVSQNVAPAV
jgi:integrase